MAQRIVSIIENLENQMAITFLKKGKESVQIAEKEAVLQEQRKEEQGKMWRFWMKLGEDAKVTFADGDLDAEGFLVPPRFYEHDCMISGQVQHFVCPEKSNPESGDKCPICASGDRPSLVAAFTVLDHREFKSTKDQNKTHKDRPKLLIAKPKSFEMLAKIAHKRGGLAGATFDVSRLGDKDPQIGGMYDFTEKTDIAVLQERYTVEVKDPKTNVVTKVCNFKPADYESEIIFRTGDELRKLGHWGAQMAGGLNPGGTQTAAPQAPSESTTQKYSENL
jgi:hypothetical protein